MEHLPDSTAVLAKLALYPNFRFFTAAPTTSPTPASDVTGTWTTGTPSIARAFSALCLLTALAIGEQHQIDSGGRGAEDKGAVIGMVLAAARGSLVSDWMPATSVGKCTGTRTRASASSASMDTVGMRSMYYNGMIAPLSKLSVRAVLWSQGEADAVQGSEEDAKLYGCRLQQLITSWRGNMPIGDYGFNMLQLAAGNSSAALGRVLMRQGQASCIPIPGGPIDISSLAITSDLGPVGQFPGFFNSSAHRMAVATVHSTFGVQADIGRPAFYTGPVIDTVVQAGSSIRFILKNNTGAGLRIFPAVGCTSCCSVSPFEV